MALTIYRLQARPVGAVASEAINNQANKSNLRNIFKRTLIKVRVEEKDDQDIRK